MQNLLAIWNGLTLKRRLLLAAATVATFLAILAVARFASAPNMVLLYAGLDARAAGEVIGALDQRAAPYQVRGDSIYVEASARDALRMSLAGEGLPSVGGAGYELLDSLSGFGTTAQMFDAAYWRAKEGELARTILAIPDVRAARVHIAHGANEPFRRNASATASVTVTTASGQLSAEHARALRHLLASAVAGLLPENVEVIDTVSGLVGAAPEGGPLAGATAQARAEEIRRGVERLLAARVGPGRAVVEVAVELVTEAEQISERRFDPQGRVAISSETEERSEQNTGGEQGVTVASHLPDGDAAAMAGSQSSRSETRERINFEVSESSRELQRMPGGIRRLTVAVLIDDLQEMAADGTVTRSPRPAEEMEALRELVASAVGYDEARGDVLTLKSMAFEPAPLLGTEAAAPGLAGWWQGLDPMVLIQTAVLAAVALILGLFVLRPLLVGGRGAPVLPAPEGDPLALPGMGHAEPGAPEGAAPFTPMMADIDTAFEPMNAFGTGMVGDLEEDPAARLRRLIMERQAESLEILRGWLEPEEEKA